MRLQVVNAVAPRYPPTHAGADLDVIQFGDYPTDFGDKTSRRMRNQARRHWTRL